MKKFYTSLKNLNEKDDAVVGVVVAVLLIGLIVAIVLVLQTVFVPNWMEQLEAEHMDEVGNQFAMLKFAADLQSISEKNIPITTSITLGNKELPFLSSSRSFGFLRITSDECTINITNATRSFLLYPGIIKYSSANAYFLDQTFIYEAGAVISGQNEGSVMFIRPSFFVDYDTTLDEVNISFTLTNIIGRGGKMSASGYGTYPIQTNFSRSNKTLITDVQKIVITTAFPNAWHVFINSTLIKGGLDYGVVAPDDFWITSTNSSLTVNFTPLPTFEIFLDVMDIFAQIAPGWVE